MPAQFGICEWCLPETGTDAIRHAARLGFDGIQLTEQGGWETGFPLLLREMQDAYRRARDETGLTFQALHLWSLCRLAVMIHPVDSAAGRIAAESIQAAVQVCVDLEIPEIMVTSGFMSQIKNRRDFEHFGDHLHRCCEAAGARGVTVVFESTLSAEEIREIRELAGGGLKVCYDTFNPIRFHMAGTPEDDIAALGLDAIDHFHLKDGPEDMVGCSLLGQGAGRFPQVSAAIRAAGYQGWFVTENYYAAFPLNRQGSFDDLAARDLVTMRRTFAD